MTGRLLAVFFLLAPPAFARGKVIDRIVAVVGTDAITLSDLDEWLRTQGDPAIAEQARDPTLPDAARHALREKALERFLHDKILDEEARKREIRATELEIENALAGQIRLNNTTREQFLKELKQRGISVESYRAAMGREISRQKMQQILFLPKIKVSEEDVKTAYTQRVNDVRREGQVCVRHILLQLPSGLTADQKDERRKLAAAILAKARAGDDFMALARRYSQDGATAPRGGDIGCIKRGEMVPSFERAAFALKKGEVGGPVRSVHGIHVLQVYDVKGAGVKPFDQAKPEIHRTLLFEALDKEVRRWVEELKKKTHVERRL